MSQYSLGRIPVAPANRPPGQTHHRPYDVRKMMRVVGDWQDITKLRPRAIRGVDVHQTMSGRSRLTPAPQRLGSCFTDDGNAVVVVHDGS